MKHPPADLMPETRRVLFDLYNPLGDRCMAKVWRPLAQAGNEAAKSMTKLAQAIARMSHEPR